VGIAAICYCAQHLIGAGWEWLLVIPVFLAGNFVEWGMHRFVMHRRVNVWGLRLIYERHTREHHQYFTDLEPEFDTTREFRVVFFPLRVLVTLGICGTTLGLIAAWLIDANAGYIVFMTMVGQYLCYETFHYCCHCHENWFVRNMPFINTIRRPQGASQPRHYDEVQHEPDVPDRRLVPGQLRPAPWSHWYALQWLQ
jgi:hypothetical protein